MTCGKCGAELTESAKFCASCGTPTPSLPPADAGQHLLVMPEIPASGAPAVNPFATTAPPGSLSKVAASESALKAISGTNANAPAVSIEAKVTDSNPPPMSPRAVSPLAVSNVSNGTSQRTPFQEAVEKARQSVAPAALAAAAKPKKMPGTQMMANAPKRPDGAAKPSADAAASEPKKKPIPKTVAMTPSEHAAAVAAVGGPRSAVAPTSGAAAPVPSTPSGGTPQSVLAPSGYIAAPGSVLAPGSAVAPSSHGQGGVPGSVLVPGSGVAPISHGQGAMPGALAPNSYIAPSSHGHGVPPAPGSTPPGALGQQFQPQMQPPSAYGAPAPQQAPASAYSARPAPMQPLAPYQQPPAPAYPPPQWGAPPPGYAFQFVPGARVQVTWSNGQRYPATVSQVNGPQCLVVFPDGQQHWVQLQYLTPG